MKTSSSVRLAACERGLPDAVVVGEWQHPRLAFGSSPNPSLEYQIVEGGWLKQLRNREGSPDPRPSLRQHRQMGQTYETGGPKFVDWLKSANEGVQRHGVWMSED